MTRGLWAKGDLAEGRGQVSVQVAAGETLGIVGESGSGKTTLAKLFLLLERPTAGTLLFDGQDLLAFSKAGCSPYRRAVQAVLGSLQLVKPAHAGGRLVAEPLPPEDGLSPTVVRCAWRSAVPGGTQQRQRQPLSP